MTAIANEQPTGDEDPAVRGLLSRHAAARSGSAAQRQLAQLVDRALELAARLPAEDGLASAVAGLDAIESLASAVEGAKARVIADAYARAHEDLLDPDRSPGEPIKHAEHRSDEVLSRTQIAACSIGPVLHLGAGAAKALTQDAMRLVHHMPCTLAALERGELTTYQVRCPIRSATTSLTPAQAGALDELLCDRDLGAQQTGPGAHRASNRNLRRWIDTAQTQLGLQPDTTTKRKEGFAQRFIRFGITGPDGMTRLHGLLPALDAAAIDTLLDDLARTAPHGDQRTHEQRRADVFRTLFNGPAVLSPAAQLELGLQTPSFDEDGHYTVVDEAQNTQAQAAWHSIRLLAAGLGLTFPDTPKATITIDVSLDDLLEAGTTATGEHDGLREAILRGVGPIPAHVAARLCRGADLLRIVTDPLSGQPLDVGRRQPSERLSTAVQARDGTCRFPDCTRSAARADLDHIQPWRDDRPPEQQTSPANLQALCREHHRAKHQLHWHPTMHPDGTITWHNNLLAITADS